jgi:anti-sigma-K factor RskA
VPEIRKKRRIPRYVVIAAAILVIAAIGIAAEFEIEDRREEALAAEIARAESDLRELGAQVAYIKDGDLTSMNDFISAYAQVEPLEKEYDQKL